MRRPRLLQRGDRRGLASRHVRMGSTFSHRFRAVYHFGAADQGRIDVRIHAFDNLALIPLGTRRKQRIALVHIGNRGNRVVSHPGLGRLRLQLGCGARLSVRRERERGYNRTDNN